MFSNSFFRKSYHLWNSVEKYRRPESPQVTKWRMRIAYWITKAIKEHSEYVILIDSLWQKWLRYRASILRYRYLACIVKQKHSLCLITHYTQIRLEQITSSTVRNKDYLFQLKCLQSNSMRHVYRSWISFTTLTNVMTSSLTDSFNRTYISVRVSEAIVAKLNRILSMKIMQGEENNKILSKSVINVATNVTA